MQKAACQQKNRGIYVESTNLHNQLQKHSTVSTIIQLQLLHILSKYCIITANQIYNHICMYNYYDV